MDYKQNKLEFIKSVDNYLNILNKLDDIPSREKVLYYMFKFICEKKYLIDFDNCIKLKNVVHEKLSELFFTYNLRWADELHYDILGYYIINPITDTFDELSSIIMNPRHAFDIFPIDKNYTPESCFLDKTQDDKYMNNMIHEYFSTSVFSDDIFQ